MKLFKTLLVSILAVTSLATEAKIPDTIRIGVDPSYPPFEYKEQSGKLTGFGVELGNEICQRIKAKCIWVENSFDGMIPGLKARKFDLVLSSMSMTPARLKQIDFSDKTAHAPTFLVAKKGSGIEPTNESLSGKSVGVLQGSMQETYAKVHWSSARIESYQNQDQVYADLTNGRLSAALQNGVQASRGFLNTPQGAGYGFVGKELIDPKIFGPGQGIGLRREDQDLKLKINEALKAIRSDGTYNKIAKRYFDFDIYGD
jgi:lysine/arginine/ornithine transport system substrate-binding protein